MTKRKVPAPKFTIGDCVALRGQPHVFTICPQPKDNPNASDDTWVWAIRSYEHSTSFTLLPIAALDLVTE